MKNGMKYIGQKKSDKFIPSYFGSSKTVKGILKNRPNTLRVDLIEWCYSKEELNNCEADWTDALGLWPLTYNLKRGGEGGSFKGINKGKKLSKEHKRKIRETLIGYKHSEEMREKLRNRVCTNETRFKLSVAAKGNKSHLGRKLSEEHKRKISEGNKGKKRAISQRGRIITWGDKIRVSKLGAKNGMFGKHYFNNGRINYVGIECPEGFVKGKLQRKKCG